MLLTSMSTGTCVTEGLSEDSDSISSLFSLGFNVIYMEWIQCGSSALVPEGQRDAPCVDSLLDSAPNPFHEAHGSLKAA